MLPGVTIDELVVAISHGVDTDPDTGFHNVVGSQKCTVSCWPIRSPSNSERVSRITELW